MRVWWWGGERRGAHAYFVSFGTSDEEKNFDTTTGSPPPPSLLFWSLDKRSAFSRQSLVSIPRDLSNSLSSLALIDATSFCALPSLLASCPFSPPVSLEDDGAPFALLDDLRDMATRRG